VELVKDENLVRGGNILRLIRKMLTVPVVRRLQGARRCQLRKPTNRTAAMPREEAIYLRIDISNGIHVFRRYSSVANPITLSLS
jgi:hypothetical protein